MISALLKVSLVLLVALGSSLLALRLLLAVSP